MSDLPSGTVTFLFTDVEGSTRLLQELGEALPVLSICPPALHRAAAARLSQALARARAVPLAT